MDLPDSSFTICPIDFLCSSPGPAWANCVSMAWIVLKVTVGLIGAIFVSRQLRQNQRVLRRPPWLFTKSTRYPPAESYAV